jgi:flagellar hook-associated protein 2
MPGTGSISGLISGLQTDTIISKMMDLAKRPQAKMQADKTDAQLRLATWQDLNTRVLAVKSKADSIAVSGAFDNCQANSSDMSVLQASAGIGASPGTYYLKVNTRAQGHQLAGLASGTPATAFTSTAADIGTGDVRFSFGLDHSKDFKVSIDSANNTLMGLRDAINRAGGGVQASIINSGSTSSPAYQLLLTSQDTGDVSQFTIGADPTINVDFSSIVQKGTDAEIQFGADGAGGTPITVKKSTNTITDLIPGVTLNIVNPDPSKTIKLDVVKGTGAIKSSIQDFVSQYNDLSDAINAQFSFDTTSKTSQPLMGNWDLQSVQMSLSSIIGSSVSGVDKHFSALATIGITQDTSGHLQIDDAALSKALNNNLGDVSRLFASGMKSDSTYVSMLSSSSATQASPAAGWDVNITQAARQAQVTAANAFTNPLGADETLSIYANSAGTKTISLDQGWSLDRVVAEINKNSTETGATAIATKQDGTVSANSDENTYLTIRAVRYGSDSVVHAYSSLSNSTGNTTGLGNKLVSATDPTGESGTGTGLLGLDVVGTINGKNCTGSGQSLTADPTDSKSAVKGLSLLITSTTTLASKVYFTKGIATSLRDTLINMTSTTGAITKAQDSCTTEMSDLDKSIADMSDRLQTQQDKLYAQFNAMESQLAELQQQGNYLTQQFTAMNKPAA